MIPFASQRGGGQDLATHLLNAHDNEMVEVAQVRGAIAGDLHGAFKEWQVQAETLTRCRKYLYSLSINPDPAQAPLTREQYLDYIGRTEAALGLSDQPCAVVFHIKDGREHCHVVWSRIDADQQRAVHIAFDRDKLMRVTRSFARDHGLDLPAGYDKSRRVGQASLYEKEQERQTGLSKEDHKAQVTEAWRQSDDAKSFVQALAERGYLLATGKRPYVLVDLYGGMHALSKLIDDKSVRTKDVRAFLDKEFPLESLPTVEEARLLAADHRKLVARSEKEYQQADQLAELKHSHQERRNSLETERNALKGRHHELRLLQQATHRIKRDKLRADHLADMKAIRRTRYENRPTGLAEFLGRVSGVNLIRRRLHRYQDARRIKVYGDRKADLKARQQHNQEILDLRHKIHAKEVERKLNALEKVEKRELAALARDQQRDQRVRNRDIDGTMPSMAEIAGSGNSKSDRAAPDLLAPFAQAKHTRHHEALDLTAAFERAAKSREVGEESDDSGAGLENARRPEFDSPGRGRKDHDPGRGR